MKLNNKDFLSLTPEEYDKTIAGLSALSLIVAPLIMQTEQGGVEQAAEFSLDMQIAADAVRELKQQVHGAGGDFGLNSLAAEIHENAVAHGWWEEQRGLPEILMLCVSELAEALEEHRDGKPLIYGTCALRPEGCEHYDKCETRNPAECKPEGVAVELADCVIRILDYCGRAGIDIEAVILAKHEYNKNRPYRHGGKKC